MRAGRIQAVVVGSDRIAEHGDVANKIGTYNGRFWLVSTEFRLRGRSLVHRGYGHPRPAT